MMRTFIFVLAIAVSIFAFYTVYQNRILAKKIHAVQEEALFLREAFLSEQQPRTRIASGSVMTGSSLSGELLSGSQELLSGTDQQ